MKILFVSLFFPQEKAYHAGGRYVFEVIRNLSKRHEIYLATRLEERELPGLGSLRPFCREIYPYTYRTNGKRGLFGVMRLVYNYLGFSRFANNIVRGGNFDLVQVEWVEAAILMRSVKAPMVIDAHDVITKPAERSMKQATGLGRLVFTLRYLVIRALEHRTVRKFNVVFTRSENDRNYILSMEPGLDVRIVPHPAGLDITDRQIERQQNTILFLASYKYRKVNVDAALYFYREVFPLIRKSVPDAKFIIAGYGPPVELTSLPDSDPGVLVPGFVEDIDECYKKASVFVAPILVGGGIIVKVLDAMAAGTPVVTTTYGNEGIEAEPGRDLLVADDPGAFSSAVVSILREHGLAETLSKNGREFVRRRYSLDAVMDKIESAYREIVNSKKLKVKSER